MTAHHRALAAPARAVAAGLLAVALGALATARGGGAETATGLLRRQTPGPLKLDYWLYVPANYKTTERYALVVVLHPAGLRGSTYAKQWGVLGERAGGYIVLAPECRDRKRRLWKLGDEGHVLATIRHVISEYNVDPGRVLLTGFSQGAIYTYTFGLRNPMLFRAIAPFSGALIARPSPAANQILQRARGLPVYIVHGTVDDRIAVQRARAARDRLEAIGYRVTYRELPHIGHQFPPMEAARTLAWFKALCARPPEPDKPPPKAKQPPPGPGGAAPEPPPPSRK